jgi:hypothetical protein
VSSPAPAEPSQLCDGSFRSVKDGKLFNALDTLLVKSNSVMMSLVAPADVHNYYDAYLKSPMSQLRLLLWRSAVLLLRNKYFIMAHILQARVGDLWGWRWGVAAGALEVLAPSMPPAPASCRCAMLWTQLRAAVFRVP